MPSLQRYSTLSQACYIVGQVAVGELYILKSGVSVPEKALMRGRCWCKPDNKAVHLPKAHTCQRDETCSGLKPFASEFGLHSGFSPFGSVKTAGEAIIQVVEATIASNITRHSCKDARLPWALLVDAIVEKSVDENEAIGMIRQHLRHLFQCSAELPVALQSICDAFIVAKALSKAADAACLEVCVTCCVQKLLELAPSFHPYAAGGFELNSEYRQQAMAIIGETMGSWLNDWSAAAFAQHYLMAAASSIPGDQLASSIAEGLQRRLGDVLHHPGATVCAAIQEVLLCVPFELPGADVACQRASSAVQQVAALHSAAMAASRQAASDAAKATGNIRVLSVGMIGDGGEAARHNIYGIIAAMHDVVTRTPCVSARLLPVVQRAASTMGSDLGRMVREHNEAASLRSDLHAVRAQLEAVFQALPVFAMCMEMMMAQMALPSAAAVMPAAIQQTVPQLMLEVRAAQQQAQEQQRYGTQQRYNKVHNNGLYQGQGEDDSDMED